MSGGGIIVVPLVVPLVAVAGAGLAAVLVIRAAAAGTAATGRALEHFGAEMERLAAAQDDLAIRTRLWEAAASAVVSTNQELRLLIARAEQVGLQPELPPFIDLTRCALADTRALVAHAQDALAAARTQVIRAEAERDRQVLLAKLAIPLAELPSTAELISQHRQAFALRWAKLATSAASVVPPAPADQSVLQAEIDQILLRLDPDAIASEREQVMAAVARAEKRSGDAATARTYLDSLRRLVDKKINPRVARRREAAGLLSGLTHPAVGELIGELVPPRPSLRDSIERLQAVERGEAELTDSDLRAAHRELSWLSDELERRRLLDAVAEAFAGLGYSVTTGLEVHHCAGLSLTKPSWHGEHTADVWLDVHDKVQFRLVQRALNAVGEATHCAELDADAQQVSDQLERRGLAAKVDLPAEPLPAVRRIEVEITSDLPEQEPIARVHDDGTSR